MRTGGSAFVRSAAVFMLLLSVIGSFAITPGHARAQDTAAAASSPAADVQPAAVETPAAPAAEVPAEVNTDTPTPTETPTSEPTQTPAPTETETATEAPTETATEAMTATDAPAETATETATDVATQTPTATVTDVATETSTDTPTQAPEPTGTATAAPSEAPASPSAAATEAAPSPTATPSPSPTATATKAAVVQAAADGFDVTIHLADSATSGPATDTAGGAGIQYLENGQFALVYDGADGASDGVVHLSGIPAGAFGFSFYKTPSGYNAPASNPRFTVSATDPNDFTVALDPAAANVTVRFVDTSHNLITDATYGGCINGLGFSGYVCDGDDGRLDGIIELQAQAGIPDVREWRAPDGYGIKRITPVTIPASGSVSVDIIHDAGVAVTIRVVDQNGALLFGDGYLGACFQVQTASFGILPCDGDDGVQDGLVHINLAPGSITITPAIYVDPVFGDHSVVAVQDFVFEVTQAGPNVATVVIPENGGAHVTTVDQFGASVPGACYTATSDWNTLSACDGDDGHDDGVTQISGLYDSASLAVFGVSWSVSETTPPTGFTAAADQLAEIPSGGNAKLTFINTSSATLTVNVMDNYGHPVKGASFSLDHAASGPAAASVVTVSDGDNNGSLQFTGLTPGSYVLTQTVAPAGFAKTAAQTVTITAGGANSVTVTDSPATFSLVVHSLLSGAVNPPITDTDICYSLIPLAKNGPIHQVDACDSADGQADGQTHFDNILGSFADYGNVPHLTSNPAFLENSGREQVADTDGVKNFNFYFGENVGITVTRLGRDGHPLVLHNDAGTGVCFAETYTDMGSVDFGTPFWDADDGILDGVASHESFSPGAGS